MLSLVGVMVEDGLWKSRVVINRSIKLYTNVPHTHTQVVEEIADPRAAARMGIDQIGQVRGVHKSQRTDWLTACQP